MDDWGEWAKELQGPSIQPEELRRLIGVRKRLSVSLGRLPISIELAEVAAVTPEVAAASLRWNTHTVDMGQFEGLPDDD